MAKKINAAFFQTAPWEERYITSKLPKATLQFFPAKLKKSHLPKLRQVNVLSNFVNSPATTAIIKGMPKLELIATRSTGFDHIDLETATEHNIIISNIPHYGENTVAEHAMAMLLAISRRIPEGMERTRRSNFSPKGLTGFDLENKVIGIVGLGSIGQHMAKMAHGFGMQIIAFDINQDTKFAKTYGIKYATMDTLLKTADVVSLHAPYNKHTHHMINAKNIKLMKKGAVLINTARGGLVDTKAVYQALKTNKLWGVGLDVLEEEDILGEDIAHFELDSSKTSLATALVATRLVDHPRAVVTPHNAFNTQEALQRILDTNVENILAWANGKPINVIKAK